MRFVPGIGWHYWDGQRWALDKTGHNSRALKKLLSSLWRKAEHNPELAKAVRACQSANSQRGVLEIAATDARIATSVDELDADPYLLNCANGTLDLRTFELHPHNPADKITKITRAAYRPDEYRIGDFGRFLEMVIPDAEVRAYLARFAGVSLFGQTREREFTIATGTGANGKGVFYNAFLWAIGDYGHVTDPSLFLAAKSNPQSANPLTFNLMGRRFVVTSETDRDRKLASALVKNLTGGDPITARALHKMPVTFIPSHTVLLVTNYPPKVDSDDPALWRRIRVIPFDVVVPEGQRDPELGEQLKSAADEVLMWAIEGLREYYAIGMNPPPPVLAATEIYKSDNDDLSAWIDDQCHVSPTARAPFGKLWASWQEWCHNNSVPSGGRTSFGNRLTARGFISNKQGVTERTGVSLKPEAGLPNQ